MTQRQAPGLSCPEQHGSSPLTPIPAFRPRRAPGASLFSLEEDIDMALFQLRSIWRRLRPTTDRYTSARLRRQIVRPRPTAPLPPRAGAFRAFLPGSN